MGRRNRRERGVEGRRDAVVPRRLVHTLPSGRRVELEQLTLQDFLQAKRQALHEYKREYVKTWTENADLLPESERRELLRDAFERAAELTYEDLPQRTVRVGGRDRQVDYPTWWASQTPEGMLYSVWLSMRRCDPGATLDDANALFTDELSKLDQAELDRVANLVGEMSGSELLAGAGETDGRANPTRPPTAG